MKRVSGFIVASVFLLSFSLRAGIIRHDVPKQHYTDLAHLPNFLCAGQVIRQDGATGWGSCVLIGKRHVLTAAHVVVTLPPRGKGASPAQATSDNERNFAVRFREQTYAVKRIVAHPAYTDPATRGACDIAILELTTSVPIAPAIFDTTGNEIGAIVTGVGFGAFGVSTDPLNIGDKPERIAGENVIDSIGGYELDGIPTLLFADFDHPRRGRINSLGADSALALEYLPTGGDSGGPLFRRDGNGF